MSTTSKIKINERLERLVHSPVCPAEDASKYARELREFADRFADSELARRESRFFKALADEIRIRILKLLLLREMYVCELMIALSLTQPTTSHHLGILEREGLIKKRREGKWTYYAIKNPELFKELNKLGLINIKR